MNLISGIHHLCKRRKYAFMIFRKYTIIFHKQYIITLVFFYPPNDAFQIIDKNILQLRLHLVSVLVYFFHLYLYSIHLGLLSKADFSALGLSLIIWKYFMTKARVQPKGRRMTDNKKLKMETT